MWSHYNDLHVKGSNLHNLLHRKYIWLHCRNKTSFFRTLRIFWRQVPADQTFEINGHGAFVWSHYNELHVKEWNRHNLLHMEYIGLHCRNKTSVFRTLWLFWRQDPADPTFEINGLGASVWSHYNDLHVKGWNLLNLLHIKYVWLHWCNKTSLFRTLWLFWRQDLTDQTFEINGHGASVWSHYNELQVKGWNLLHLLHIEYIWLHCRNKT